jgi:hypothetical protein
LLITSQYFLFLLFAGMSLHFGSHSSGNHILSFPFLKRQGADAIKRHLKRFLHVLSIISLLEARDVTFITWSMPV